SRPVLYTAAAPAAESDPNNRRSFPSGHAALAFAAATSYTVLAGRERLPHRTRNAVLLYAGAVGISALRVAGGKHFPTDVAGGAALGAGIGWLVATIHAPLAGARALCARPACADAPTQPTGVWRAPDVGPLNTAASGGLHSRTPAASPLPPSAVALPWFAAAVSQRNPTIAVMVFF